MTQHTSASDPLPAPIQRELEQIAADLNNMPRECARDHGALCLWKGRIARRVRALKDMRVSARVLRLPAPILVELRPAAARRATKRAGGQMEMGL